MCENEENFVKACENAFGVENVRVVNMPDQAIVDLAKREAKRKYQREWRRKNPDKVKEYNDRYWEKKGNDYLESFGKSSQTATNNISWELPKAAKNHLADGYERLVEFRGYKGGEVQWVYGDLYQYLNGAKAIRPYGKIQPISVLRKTIGQYVGCIDVNGQKIYEGDIVNMSMDGVTVRLVVKFCAGAFVLCSKKNGDVCIFPLILAKNAEYEVIGNVHDNPELMEDK